MGIKEAKGEFIIHMNADNVLYNVLHIIHHESECDVENDKGVKTVKDQRMASVENWARYVKSNKNWKNAHTKFINAQFKKHEMILSKLSREKIIKLYGIKNLNGYSELLNNHQPKL